MAEKLERVDLAVDVPVELLAKSDYAARPDSQRPGFHVEIPAGVVRLPASADFFEWHVDRRYFPDTTETVVILRGELSLDDGLTWNHLCGFKGYGGKRLNIDGTPMDYASGRYSVSGVGIENRLVRVLLIPVQDINTKIDVVARRVK